MFGKEPMKLFVFLISQMFNESLQDLLKFIKKCNLMFLNKRYIANFERGLQIKYDSKSITEEINSH